MSDRPPPEATGPTGQGPSLTSTLPEQSAELTRPTIAAFDFDGTLTDGGSVLPFLVAVRGVVPVGVAVLRTLPKLARAAVVGGTAADDAKEQLFMRLLAGQRAEQVAAIAESFAARHLERHLRPEVRARVEWHRASGHRLVVISASPEYYVRPAGNLLGFDAAIGTRLAVDASGLLTGRYEGKNCRGAEKYARLVGWQRANGLGGNSRTAQPVLWAYGNSRGDIRLLTAADHGIDVGRLGRWGRLRQFSRLGERAPGTGGGAISQTGSRR